LALNAAVAVDAMVVAFKEGTLARAYGGLVALEGPEGNAAASGVSPSAVAAASVRLESEVNIAKNQSDFLRLGMRKIIQLMSAKQGGDVSEKLRGALSLTLMEIGLGGC
jgi:hypothetical protein